MGIIKERVDKIKSLTLKLTNYTIEEIQKLDDNSSNTYMSYIAPYKLREYALSNWIDDHDVFYKGLGLIKLASLDDK